MWNGSFDTLNVAGLAYDGASGFSLFGWVKINVEELCGVGPKIYLNIDGSNDIEIEFANNANAGNAFASWFSNPEIGPNGDMFDDVTVGVWQFFHLFYDPLLTKIGFSVNNGANQYSAAGIVFPASATGSFQFGSLTAITIDVTFDEIGVKMDDMLTAAEVTYLYNAGAGRTWPL